MSNKKCKYSNGAFCDYDVIRTLPRICTPQFLDTGWNLLIVSNNLCFREEFRVCKKDVEKLIDPALNVSGYFFLCEPKSKNFKHFRSRILYFHSSMSLRGLLEVVVHEVSHLVDNTLEFIKLTDVDTELRAYMMDHYCGKIFDMLDFSSGKKKPKFLTKKHIAKADATKLDNTNDRIARLRDEVKNKGIKT